MLATTQHLVLRKIIKNLRTTHILFWITYWKLSNGMSAAYNLSWNTDINCKCLRPNNKYSLKVLWVKYQISNAYVKCQINDFKCDSSISMGHVIPQPVDCLKIRHTPSQHICLRSLEYHDIQKSKKQTAKNWEIFPYIHNKGLQNSLTWGSLGSCRDIASQSSYALI